MTVPWGGRGEDLNSKLSARFSLSSQSALGGGVGGLHSLY